MFDVYVGVISATSSIRIIRCIEWYVYFFMKFMFEVFGHDLI